MRGWVELLPLFVVRWLAMRYCERVPIGGRNFRIARYNERLVAFRDYRDDSPPYTGAQGFQNDD